MFLCNPMDSGTPRSLVLHYLPVFAQIQISIESVMLSNHLFLCSPFSFCLQFFPSIRVFSNESTLCIKWPKNWSFSFSISPSSEYSRLISFRMSIYVGYIFSGNFLTLLRTFYSYETIYVTYSSRLETI